MTTSTFRGYVIREKGARFPVRLDNPTDEGTFAGIFSKRSAADFFFLARGVRDPKGRLFEFWRVTLEVDYSRRTPRAGEIRGFALHDSGKVRPYTDADGWVYGLGTTKGTMERMTEEYATKPIVSPVQIKIRYDERVPIPREEDF